MKQHKKNKKLMISVMSILVAVLFINSAVASISIDYEQNNDVDEVTQKADISVSSPEASSEEGQKTASTIASSGLAVNPSFQDPNGSPEAKRSQDDDVQPLDIWDLMFHYDTGGDASLYLLGVAFDGEYFYQSSFNSATFYYWDIDGNYEGTFTMSGTSGIIDMCYDGEYTYGCAYSGYTLYVMDLAAQEVVDTISLPSASYNVAYDSDDDAFWIGQWQAHLTKIDRDGNVIDTMSPPDSMLGMAYDNTFTHDEYDGPFLWISTGTSTGMDCIIKCIDIATKSLIPNLEHNVPKDPAVDTAGMSGGLWMDYLYEPGKSVLMGSVQGVVNDYIYGYEISLLTPPEHDVALRKIISPQSGYATGDIPMQVTVKNYGNHTETTDVQMDIIKCEGQDEWLLDENFTGITNITFPPEGWTTDWWNISNTNEAGGEAPEAYCNKSVQMAAGDNYDNYLLSPPVNATGWDKINLRFALSVDIFQPNMCYLYVKYRKNSTSSWKDLTPWKNPIGQDFTEWFEIGCYGWGEDIGNEFQFNFSFMGYANYFNYFYLDDITIETCAGCDEYSMIVEDVVVPKGEEVLVDFPAWTPSEWHNETYENAYEEYPVYAYTLLDDDNSRNNDKRKMIELYYPWMHDISAVDIQGPVSGPGQTFPLTGQIKNLGQYEECCFDTTVIIQEVSYDNPVQLWTEDFQTASARIPPAGWSIGDSYMYAWYFGNYEYYLPQPYGQGLMPYLYSYYAGGAELISPVINTELYREEMTGGAVSVRSVNMTNMTAEEMFNAEPETLRLDDYMATPFNAQTDPVTIEGEVSALNLGPGWPNTAYVEIGVRPEATKNSRNAGVYLIAFNVENTINETWIHLQDYTGNGNENPNPDDDYADVITIDRNSDFQYEITLTPNENIGGTATLEIWVDEESKGTSTLDYGYESTWEEKVPGPLNEDFSDAYLFYAIIADRRGEPFKTYRATVGDIMTDSETSIGAMYFEMGSYIWWTSGKGAHLIVEIRPDPNTEWIDITPWQNPVTENVGPGWFSSDATAGIGPQTQLRFSFEGIYTNFQYWFWDNPRLAGYDATPPEFETKRCIDGIIPGETADLNFADWTPEFLAEETTGTKQYAVKMETKLIDPLDVNVRNNVVTEKITLDFFHDVGVQEITSPSLKGSDRRFYAVDTSRNKFVWFDPETPGVYNDIATTPMTQFPQGATFIDELWWICDTTGNIWTVDPETGDTTTIGNAGTGELVSLSYHEKSKTMYGGSSYDLYTIDMETGKATKIGPFQQLGYYMISLDCDNDGVMYGYDLNYELSKLYTVDLETGKATIIGDAGINMMYGQDMAYDNNEGIMYACVYNAGMGRGELNVIDLETGKFTLVGILQGGAQTTCFAIPGHGGPSVFVPLGPQKVNGVVENLGTFLELDLTCSAEIYEYITSCENGTLVYSDMIVDIDLDEPLGGTEALFYADYDFAIEGIYELVLNLSDDNDDKPRNNIGTLVIGVDATPPDSWYTLNPEIPDGDNGWYVNDVEVTLTAEDAEIGCEQPGSGIKEIKYKIGDDSWQTFPGGEGIFVIDDDADDLLIQYYAIDNIGNTESTNSFTINMDQTVPVISEATWEAFQKPPLSGHWYVTFTCDAEDLTSKMDRVEFFINDGLHEIVEGIGPNYTFEIEWSEAFRQHTFWFYHYDVAGNMIADDIPGNNVTAYPQSKQSSNLQQYPTQRTHR